MLSKNRIKYVNSLALKKVRDAENVFVAEGVKLVSDLISSFDCELLLFTEEFADFANKFRANEKIEVTVAELLKVSAQKSPQGVFAVFCKKTYTVDYDSLKNDLVLALDDVQDPGNLGTIVRVADWFGIKDIFCSLHSADVYGHKTVQATMGALARVRVHYIDILQFITVAKESVPVYGTFMDGQDLYECKLTNNGVIVMGNEGNGISAELQQSISQKILFPSFPGGLPTSESLNVGVATAVVCAEFRRRAR